MAIYKKIKGTNEVVKLSNKQIKAEIMKVHGWTSEEYQRHYDIFKNKLRNYESYKRAHGVDVVTQSPQELLYKQAKAMQRDKGSYKPTMEMQRIMNFTSQSMSKSKQQEQLYKKGITPQSYVNVSKKYERYTNERFKGLVESNEIARKLSEGISDPVKREQALAEFANSMHAVIDKRGVVSSKTGFNVGVSVGSGSFNDFDYKKYLDNPKA